MFQLTGRFLLVPHRRLCGHSLDYISTFASLNWVNKFSLYVAFSRVKSESLHGRNNGQTEKENCFMPRHAQKIDPKVRWERTKWRSMILVVKKTWIDFCSKKWEPVTNTFRENLLITCSPEGNLCFSKWIFHKVLLFSVTLYLLSVLVSFIATFREFPKAASKVSRLTKLKMQLLITKIAPLATCEV